MRTYNSDEFRVNEDKLIKKISEGAVFVHPTDTVYGIGCDATKPESVKKVRKAKGGTHPFSVIAPSKQWIRENCEVDKKAEQWLEKLPGPYTLILKLKKNNAVAKETNSGMKTIGIRMPDHWIQDIALAIKKPIITTSANITGMSFMTSLETLHKDLESTSDFAVYEGPTDRNPSTIVDLASGEKIIRR